MRKHPRKSILFGFVTLLVFLYNNCSQGIEGRSNPSSTSAALAVPGPAPSPISNPPVPATPPAGTISGNHPFPRLGSYFIGGQPGSAYNLAWANYLAAFNVNIIGGYTGTGAGMYGGSRKAFVAEVLSLSPANVKTQMFQYYLVDSGDPGSKSFDGLQYGLWNLTAANPNWWAWVDAKTQTSHVYNTYWNKTWYETNSTLAAGTNSAGLYFEEAAAKNQYETFWQSTSADAAPNLAGLFHDNFFPISEVSYDYNFSGTPTAGTPAGSSAYDANFAASLQQGMAMGPNWIHKNTKALILGNVAVWGSPSNPPLTYYNQILNGGVFEGVFGESWSTISWSGGSAPNIVSYGKFQNQYSIIMSKMLAPAYVILGHDLLTSTGTDPYQNKSYAALRFGLTATLVNGDGYYFGNMSYDVGTGSWYDEYAVDASGTCLGFNGTISSVAAGRGYLGFPTSAWGTISGTGKAVQIGGLWTRLFYNASTGKTWVVINSPPGSGSLTINASSFGRSSFKMLSGKQDPTTNNGKISPSISIPAGYDGRIAELL